MVGQLIDSSLRLLRYYFIGCQLLVISCQQRQPRGILGDCRHVPIRNKGGGGSV